MTIAIQDVPFRNLYTASAAQTVFSVNFPFMSDTYLAVYQRAATDEPDNITQLLVLGVDYTVTGVGSETGGSITLTAPATAGDIIAILSVEPVDRTSVFNDLNSFTVTMNQQLNDLTIMVKQMDTVLNELVPKYRIDELVSTTVRPDKLELPILNDGQTWVGQGDIGDLPDNIIAATAFPEELLEVEFVIGTANAFLPNAQVLADLTNGIVVNVNGFLDTRTITGEVEQIDVTNPTGQAGNLVVSITNNPIIPGTEGFMWPTGTTGERPGSPDEGRARYNTTSGQWEGWNGSAWVNFVDTGGTVVSASYVTLSDESGVLPTSFSLGSLASGLVLNTVALGVSTLSEAIDGADYLSPATGATRELDNLTTTAINADLLPDTDGLVNLGDPSLRFGETYTELLRTGDTAADTIRIQGYDVDGASYTTFLTITAGNSPTAVLSGAVEGITQAPMTSDLTLATTEYVDLAVAGGGGGYLPLAGGTMLGSLILNADPVVALEAATKQYVDLIAAGFDIKEPAYAATTGALTVTYANGALGVGATLTNAGAQAAFSVDGVSPPITSRILIKNQASTFQNGIYTLTIVGTGATNWVLTRATDYDTAAEINTGDLVIVENGTINAATGWLETATVATMGTDPITFTQFAANTGANTALSNLAAVAINTALLSAADNTLDLGSATNRWQDLYALTLKTGTTIGNTLLITARDVDGAADTTFITLTAGNTPTCALSTDVTGATQSFGDSSTKLATTAFTQAARKQVVNAQTAGYTAVAADQSKVIRYTGAGGVTLALDPAATLADGWFTTLRNDSAGVITINPNGAETINGAATLDVAAGEAVIIYTNGTLFYTVGESLADGANKALSNLASVAINTTLVSDTDVTDNLGTQAIRWNNIYAASLQTGDTAADVLNIGAWDVDGAAISNFITLTAGNTPTCALASGVTAVTQSASDNSTKLATTAYADAVGSAGFPALSPASTYWYSTPGILFAGSSSSTNINMATGKIYYIPFIVTKSTTYTAIGMISGSTVSGSSNLCLYNDDGASRPTGSPIANSTSGSLTNTSVTASTFTFGSTITLNPGRYWLAISTSATSNVAGSTTTQARPMTLGIDPTLTLANFTASQICWSENFTYSTTMPTVGGSLTKEVRGGLGDVNLFLKAQ